MKSEVTLKTGNIPLIIPGQNLLERSGINGSYEYVLRKLCQEGLPKTDIFGLCAYYVLEYQKLLEENEIRQRNLKDIVVDDKKSTKQKNQEKQEFPFEDVTVEKLILKQSSGLKSRELLNYQTSLKKDRGKLIKRDFVRIEDVSQNPKEDQKKIESESINIKDITKLEKYFDDRNGKFLKEFKSTLPPRQEFIKLNFEDFKKNLKLKEAEIEKDKKKQIEKEKENFKMNETSSFGPIKEKENKNKSNADNEIKDKKIIEEKINSKTEEQIKKENSLNNSNTSILKNDDSVNISKDLESSPERKNLKENNNQQKSKEENKKDDKKALVINTEKDKVEIKKQEPETPESVKNKEKNRKRFTNDDKEAKVKEKIEENKEKNSVTNSKDQITQEKKENADKNSKNEKINNKETAKLDKGANKQKKEAEINNKEKVTNPTNSINNNKNDSNDIADKSATNSDSQKISKKK